MTNVAGPRRVRSGLCTSYFITGGAGFIGSHLAHRLIEHGHSVVAIDDLSTGRHANIAQLAGVLRFRFIAGSAADATAIDPLVQSCDVVSISPPRSGAS